MSKSIINSYTSRDELYMYREEKRDIRPLTIHVEDVDDMVFWRKVFIRYASCLNIHFSTQRKTWDEKRQKDVNSSGKSQLMKMIKQRKITLSESEIACVDADYDLLIADDFTNELTNIPFIFTTCWHSIENIICHPNNLQMMYLDLLRESCCPDFQKWIEQKSCIYAPLFLYLLCSRQCGTPDEYPTDAMIDDIQAIEAEQKTIKEVLNKYQTSLTLLQCGIDTLAKNLHNMGYGPKDYYKIMQGHMLEHQIVRPYIKNILHDEFQKRGMDLGKIEFAIDSFLMCHYSVEHLDITNEIRAKIENTLNIL